MSYPLLLQNGYRLKLTKSIYLLRDVDTVAIVYNFTKIEKPVEFVLRPFVGFARFPHSTKVLCSAMLQAGPDNGLLDKL